MYLGVLLHGKVVNVTELLSHCRENRYLLIILSRLTIFDDSHVPCNEQHERRNNRMKVVRGFVALLMAAFMTKVAVMAEKNVPGGEKQRGKGNNTILMEDFSKPIHKWSTMNDPVRG